MMWESLQRNIVNFLHSGRVISALHIYINTWRYIFIAGKISMNNARIVDKFYVNVTKVLGLEKHEHQ